MNTFFGRFRSKSAAPLESELRAARPQPPERLVDSIVGMVSQRPAARPARLRLAFAGGLTVALVAVAGATGGLSYAALAIKQVASAVHITSAKPSSSSPQPVHITSACSQYAVAPIVSGISPTYGVPGDSVVISGNNFAGNSAIVSVTFGGRGAGFVVNGNTQVTATVPSGARSGSVVVANCKGSAGGGRFTVYYKRPCVVPNVIGLSLSAAKHQIYASYCTVGNMKLMPKHRRPGTTWYVTAQSPNPGKVKPHGYPVNLKAVAS